MTALGELFARVPVPWWGALLLALALVTAVWAVASPSRGLSLERRRAGAAPQPTALNRAAGVATTTIGQVLDRRDVSRRWTHALDLAGIRMGLPEFVLLVGAGALAAMAVGLVIGGVPVAILLTGFAVAGAVIYVVLRADSRRSAFAEQLDDMLQLLAGNMRAGHSLLQSFDSLASELDEPSSSEIARVVNQTRVGRDLGESLDEAAERMDSDDFRWIAQAIAIHRQVGGNLADVLDSVSETIRERGQIRRQVKALSSEGRLSAIILIALPFVVALALLLLNPDYLSVLTQSLLGYFLIGLGCALLVVGALWMRKVVEVKF